MIARRNRLVAFALLAAIAVALWFVSWETPIFPPASLSPNSVGSNSEPRDTEVPQRSAVVAPKPQIVADQPALASLPPPRGEEPSHLADKLHSPDRTGAEDLSVVMNLFAQYRSRFRGYPVGEDNAAFVNALAGNNPGRLAFIGRNHPAIDAQGQLLDRWGEPYFFHILGRDALEVRSAGPDRELYTADDLLEASPGVQEPGRSER
jgi:hypothetical protein